MGGMTSEGGSHRVGKVMVGREGGARARARKPLGAARGADRVLTRRCYSCWQRQRAPRRTREIMGWWSSSCAGVTLEEGRASSLQKNIAAHKTPPLETT